MDEINCLLGNYTCSVCKINHKFSEKINNCSVRKFTCNHFTLILMRVNDIQNNFKLKLTFICNKCFKPKNADLSIGQMTPQFKLKTDEEYIHICCQNTFSILVFLSQIYIEQNETSNQISNNSHFHFNNDDDSSYNYNNINLINHNNNNNNNNNLNNINFIDDNDNDNNINNNTIANINELDNFESMNIIEFNKKSQLVVFFSEETNKKYKLYVKPNLRLKNVLDDLVDQNPEVNYKGKNIFLNGKNVNISLKINDLNLRNNSILIIK